jgi:hypothetical protein
MKKIAVLVGTCLGMASQAHAMGSLNLDARMDYLSYGTNDAVGKPGYEAFQVTRLKLDYQGSLGELNFFRTRVDLLQNSATNTADKRDKVSKYLDFAYLTRKISDTVNFSMGKIITSMGGTEGSNNPGDVYLRSTAGDEDALVYWPVGAQAEVKLGDQKLKINAANNTEDIYDDSTKQNVSQTGNLLGATWLGQFAGGAIQPNVSWHQEKFTSTSHVNKTNSYGAVGSRLRAGDFEFELDYLANDYGKDPQASKDVLSTHSGVALARYKLNDFGSVHLKYEDTNQTVGTGVTTQGTNLITGMTAAVEYKPVQDENWRMHVAVTKKDTHPNSGDTQSETSTYVGMRLLADFLK